MYRRLIYLGFYASILATLVGCAGINVGDRSQPALDSPATVPVQPSALVTQTAQILPLSADNQPTDTQTSPTRSFTPSPTQIPTSTPTPTWTPLPPPAETFTPLPTDPPNQEPPLPLGKLSGRILYQGVPLDQGVVLVLEDQGFNPVQEITVSAGEYFFENLPASSQGYNVLFAQEKNPRFDLDQVVSWGWIGPMPVQDGDNLWLPDLEIALLGLQQIAPPPDTFFTSTPITPQNPLYFEWTPYPAATQYWLDLRAGRSLELVWQSAYIGTTAIAFEGVLSNGETIQPGTYWWSVSARIDEVFMTISGPLAGFTLKP